MTQFSFLRKEGCFKNTFSDSQSFFNIQNGSFLSIMFFKSQNVFSIIKKTSAQRNLIVYLIYLVLKSFKQTNIIEKGLLKNEIAIHFHSENCKL
jgi:hypothetical protein